MRAEWLLSGLLLAGDGALRALAGKSVGLGALPVHGQAATVTDALVASDFDLAANVGGDLTAKVTLNLVVALDVVTKGDQLFVGEILDADLAADTGVRKRLERLRAANTVDIGKCDFYALI